MCEFVRDTCSVRQVPERAASRYAPRQPTEPVSNARHGSHTKTAGRGWLQWQRPSTTKLQKFRSSDQQFLCRIRNTRPCCAAVISVAMKPSKMISGDYSLELNNIFHTGHIEPTSCFQRLLGSVQTGLILKDITLEVRAGEVMAILGSKGNYNILYFAYIYIVTVLEY